MNNLNLFLFECSPSDLSQTLGPYLEDRVRRRGGLPGGGLGLFIAHSSSTFQLCAGDTGGGDYSAGMVWFMKVSVVMGGTPKKGETEKMASDLVRHIPREQIIDLRTTLPILYLEELCVEMRNLTRLLLDRVDLPTFFVEPGVYGSHVFMDLLHSLDHIVIIAPTLSGGDWSPLTDFLSRRAAAGNPISSLWISCRPHMDEDVAGNIKRAVKGFKHEGSDDGDGSDDSNGSGGSDGSDDESDY